MAALQLDGRLWVLIYLTEQEEMARAIEAECRELATGGKLQELSQKLGMKITEDNLEAVLQSIQTNEDDGVPVRKSESLDSTVLRQRLCHNAVVREIVLNGTQLHYELVDGIGPPTGWVDICPHGQELFVQMPAAKKPKKPKGAFMRFLKPDPDPDVNRVDAEQQQELQGLLCSGKDPTILYRPGDASYKEDEPMGGLKSDLSIRDESGFVADDGDPMHYVTKEELRRQDGEEYVVVYKNIAVRRSPHVNGKVIGMKSLGDHLDLFEWDSTYEWRAVLFKLRGGWGSTVKAWVMIKHEKFGVLLKPFHGSEPASEPVPVSPTKDSSGAEFDKENFSEGQRHEVVQKRVAIRDDPSMNGNMLGAIVEGQIVRLFEWDSEKVFRRINYRIHGGWGEPVEAWVKIEDPQLGILLKPIAEDDAGTLCSNCGKVQDMMERFGLCDDCFKIGLIG